MANEAKPADRAGAWPERLGVWWIAENHPDLPAIVASPSGPLTFGALAGRAHRLVHALRRRGLQADDVVAVLLPNDVDIVVCSLACHEAGWYFLPLNPHLSAGEIEAILAHSGARVFISHGDYAAQAVGATGAGHVPVENRVAVGGGLDGFEPYDALVRGAPDRAPDDRRAGQIFSYTSGTTGEPKGIRRAPIDADPSALASEASVFGRAFAFEPLEGVNLVCTSMHHVGSHSFYLGALNVGQGLVIMGKFDPEEALRLIEHHRVTSSYMVPTMFHRFLQLPEATRLAYDTSSLRVVVHSAAPCPMSVKQRMLDWWGPVVWETYGGAEAAATIAKPYRWLERPGTVGRAVRGVEVSVRDDDGNLLGPGEEGLVYIRTVAPAFEYHGDPASTSAAFRDGRFTLGDIGYLDADGYLFICDRAKDMIITGGVNVYPVEVEGVLAGHPAVGDVAVIGVPDEEWGEAVLAVVAPAAGVEPSPGLAAELIGFCRERLAHFKCPRTVEFRPELPRTDAGKLYKRELRAERRGADQRAGI